MHAPTTHGMKMSVDGSVSSTSMKEENVWHGRPKEDNVLSSPKANQQPNKADEAGLPDLNSKPKRPLSAYNLFFRDQRELLLESLPSRGGRKPKRSHGKINFNDLAKTIAARWKEISPEEKEKYEKVAAVGREKYVKLAKAWKKQQRKLAKQTSKAKQKAASKAATKPATKPAARQSPMNHVAQTNEAPANLMFDDAMSERATSVRLHPQFPQPNRIFSGESSIQESAFLDSSQGAGGRSGARVFSAPVASYQSYPAFDDVDSNNTSGIGDFGIDFQLQRNESLMMQSHETLPLNVFPFDEHVQQQRQSMMMRPSMSYPQITAANTSWANTLHSFESSRMPAALPFPPTANASFPEQPPINSTWENTIHPPRRHHSLPLPSSESLQPSLYQPSLLSPPRATTVSFAPMHESSTSSLGLHTPNPRLISQDLPDFPEEPLPFDFPADDDSIAANHAGNTQQIADNMGQDCVDLFVGMFNKSNNL